APTGQRLAAVTAPPAPTALIVEPTIVDDPVALPAMVAACRAAALLALDTATSSLDPMRAELVGLSLAAAPGRSWYLPFAHVAPDGELAGGAQPRNLPALASDALAPLRARRRRATPAATARRCCGCARRSGPSSRTTSCLGCSSRSRFRSLPSSSRWSGAACGSISSG